MCFGEAAQGSPTLAGAVPSARLGEVMPVQGSLGVMPQV